MNRVGLKQDGQFPLANKMIKILPWFAGLEDVSLSDPVGSGTHLSSSTPVTRCDIPFIITTPGDTVSPITRHQPSELETCTPRRVPAGARPKQRVRVTDQSETDEAERLTRSPGQAGSGEARVPSRVEEESLYQTATDAHHVPDIISSTTLDRKDRCGLIQ